jgi:hypothetical protein
MLLQKQGKNKTENGQWHDVMILDKKQQQQQQPSL